MRPTSNCCLETHAPDAPKVFSRASLEDLNVKPMANTVSSSRYTGKTSPNDSYFRSTKLCMRPGRGRGQDFVEQPLNDVVNEKERMKIWILHYEFGLPPLQLPVAGKDKECEEIRCGVVKFICAYQPCRFSVFNPMTSVAANFACENQLIFV